MLIYKTTDCWAPEHERTLCWDDPDLLCWDDPDLAIRGPLENGERPLLSDKDWHGALLREAEIFDEQPVGSCCGRGGRLLGAGGRRPLERAGRVRGTLPVQRREGNFRSQF